MAGDDQVVFVISAAQGSFVREKVEAVHVAVLRQASDQNPNGLATILE